MATGTDNEITTLLVVGKTGVGKSATANTILGRKEFLSRQTTTSVTQTCQHAIGNQNGREVMMVDMPGLSEAGLSEGEDIVRATDMSQEAVNIAPDGYDAILIVVAFGRFTLADKKIIRILKSIFGEQYIKQYGILVVTHCEQFDPEENDSQCLDDWCAAQEGDFQDLITECEERVVFFQNKTSDQNIRRQQLEQLFAIVDELMLNDNRYTPQVFEAAQASRYRLALEQEVEDITQEMEANINLILEESINIADNESAQALERLTKLKSRVGKLINQIQRRDNGTGILNRVKIALERAEDSVTTKLEAVKQGMRRSEELHEMRTELKNLTERLEVANKRSYVAASAAAMQSVVPAMLRRGAEAVGQGLMSQGVPRGAAAASNAVGLISQAATATGLTTKVAPLTGIFPAGSDWSVLRLGGIVVQVWKNSDPPPFLM